MKRLLTQTLVAVFAAGTSLAALADTASPNGYLIDQRGGVAKTGSGSCVRTGYWVPSMALAECDPDLVKKPTAVAPVAAAPKAAPAPAPATPKPTAEKVNLAADTLFDFDRADLRADGQGKLDELAGSLKAISLEAVLVVGHSDRLGGAAYNQKLSERRAAAVKDYLVGRGIDANRVQAAGKGASQPVTQPDQCKGPKSAKVISCLQPDRRVAIEVIGTRIAK